MSSFDVEKKVSPCRGPFTSLISSRLFFDGGVLLTTLIFGMSLKHCQRHNGPMG